MKKILIIISLFNFLIAAEVQELLWPKGETFLTFLEKYSIPQKLYFDLEKEDKELCSEITADNRFYKYLNDDGSLNQVLIPVSEDIQLHIYQDIDKQFKFQTLPINYIVHNQTVAVQINESVSSDILKSTGDIALAMVLKSIFQSSVNFRRMQKGDWVVINYSQKVLLGKTFGFPDIKAAMVQISGKPFYRFKNEKDDKYYDEKGVGFTKIYQFKIPLSYSRISSVFSPKRYHPVLKRYRAHLGTDFAAPIGRKIYAAADGKVEFVGNRGGYGKTTIINHGNGYKTLYAHQNGYASSLRSGRKVKQGDHIGYVGNTGLSSGPHLHLGLYKNGVAVDPMKVIKQPKTQGLNGKDKATFLANIKNIKGELDSQTLNINKPEILRFDRKEMKSNINIL